MLKLPYKKLKIWKKGLNLAKKTYELTNNFPKQEVYGLTSQMRRSAISIPSNVAEGSQRISNKEFSNYILIARGSLAELETQIILAESFNYFQENESSSLLSTTDELDKMLFAFYKTLTTPHSSLTTRK